MPAGRRSAVERSDEMRDRLLDLMGAMASGETTVTDALSTSPDMLAIGTDPAEWWEGDRAVKAWQAQIETFDDSLTFVPSGHAKGWVEGTVGWAAEEFTMTTPVAADVGVRTTGVWHREDDGWRLIQFHASIGVPNDESFGEDLPV